MNSVPRSMGPLQQGPGQEIGTSSPQQSGASALVQVRVVFSSCLPFLSEMEAGARL